MVAGSSPAGCAIKAALAQANATTQYGGRSSVGRAQDCGSWCRGFDSHRPPHIRENARLKVWRFRFNHADVVKLVDTPDLGSGAARCESSSLSVRTISQAPLLRKAAWFKAFSGCHPGASVCFPLCFVPRVFPEKAHGSGHPGRPAGVSAVLC